VAQAVQSTEPRSVTLAELPAHLWAKPALWARTLPYLSLNLFPYLQGRRAPAHLVQGRVTVYYFKSNNKDKLNNKVLVIRSWDQSEALMICARCVSFLTWWQCGTPTGDRTWKHAPGHGPSEDLGWRGRWL